MGNPTLYPLCTICMGKVKPFATESIVFLESLVMVGKYDFRGDDDDTLSFKRGERLYIISMVGGPVHEDREGGTRP